MKPDLLRFLLIEDSDDDAELVLRALKTCAAQIQFERITTQPEMQKALLKGEWDLVISDYNLPEFSGLEAIDTLQASQLDIPLILVSGTIGEATAVNAVKKGAADYVLKDSLARLPTAVENALRERKAAQDNRLLVKQLAQAQKMESIGRLAGGLAHDVNNVLAAICLYAELGIRKLNEGDSTAAIQSFKNILRGQQSAAGIIRQLLIFSKRQVGPSIVLDFASVIHNMEPLLKRLIGENIELTVECPEGEAVPVTADPAQIEQIILNLAVNARDAMPTGGKLSFKLEKANVPQLPENIRLPCAAGYFAVLTAKDSGCGMSPETLQKIFEPFFTTKELGKGSGLGLSVIYGILERENGTMTVESVLSQGTTFQIFWPLSKVAVPEPIASQEAKISPSIGAAKILLVEDEENLRMPFAEMLRDFGFEVHEANNGVEALTLLREGKFKTNLLITDVVMPQMGGPELVRKAREFLPDLKALFVSGYAAAGLEGENIDSVLTWFLEKPFTRESLIKKMNKIFTPNFAARK